MLRFAAKPGAPFFPYTIPLKAPRRGGSGGVAFGEGDALPNSMGFRRRFGLRHPGVCGLSGPKLGEHRAKSSKYVTVSKAKFSCCSATVFADSMCISRGRPVGPAEEGITAGIGDLANNFLRPRRSFLPSRCALG
jgi:hypothetical protein